ncbi:MAG: helix-turn-helix domain-containing protein [Ruminiclostridium sp.]
MVTIKLKELLKEYGMTQAELAKLTGIRPSTICDMCNGISQFIKLEHIDRICKALNCSISEFLKLD